MTLTQHIAAKLTAIRTNKQLTHHDVGRMAGISHVTVMRAESGTSSPTTRTLEKIAKGLGVPVVYFVGGFDG